MTDQERITGGLGNAGEIIAEYLRSEPRDAKATLQRLIDVLETAELAEALAGVKTGQGQGPISPGSQRPETKSVGTTELADWLLKTHKKYPTLHLCLPVPYFPISSSCAVWTGIKRRLHRSSRIPSKSWAVLFPRPI
jgi:hypothetical protein